MIEANKFQEVQKYLAGTRHMYNPQSMFISKKTWDRLNKDEQQILLDAAKESAVYQRKFSRDAQDASLANLKKTMEYTELPPAEVAKVRTKLKPVIDKYSASCRRRLREAGLHRDRQGPRQVTGFDPEAPRRDRIAARMLPAFRKSRAFP